MPRLVAGGMNLQKWNRLVILLLVSCGTSVNIFESQCLHHIQIPCSLFWEALFFFFDSHGYTFLSLLGNPTTRLCDPHCIYHFQLVLYLFVWLRWKMNFLGRRSILFTLLYSLKCWPNLLKSKSICFRSNLVTYLKCRFQRPIL